ncbi:NADH-quinone oxidoreductase subunit N [soil metagenome]
MTFADKPFVEALTGSLMLAVPEIALVGVACLLFVQGMFIKARGMNWMLAFGGLLFAAVLAAVVHPYESTAAGSPMIFSDSAKINQIYYEFLPTLGESLTTGELRTAAPIMPGSFATFIRWLTLGAGLILVLLATKEASHGIAGEYYACLLIALAGTSLVARANDLVTVFLALEMISIPTYVLLYLPNRGAIGQEAALKYFLLSILSSGIMLFGLSYLYGLAGTTNVTALVDTFSDAHRGGASPLAVLAMVLVIAGLAFRITAVPFHYYAPDVYQGGPTAVVAELAVLPKIAGFVVLARLLGFTTLPVDDLPFPDSTQIPLMLWVLAAVTMTVGNVMALIQENLKRTLAYSGIAHAGYMLLGLLAAGADTASPVPYVTGLDAILVYLVGYALMTLGVFAVIIYLNTATRTTETVDDLAGVGRTNPVAAACLAVCLLSLIGLPLTAGFVGKLLLFYSLFDVPTTAGLGVMYRVLVAIAALNAAIGAVYYLRLLGVAYLRTPLNPEAKAKGTGPLLAAILCAVGTLALGVPPLARMIVDTARVATPANAK